VTTAAETTGAEGVRWDLSDLYAGPDDPAIERDLAESLATARSLQERYEGHVAELSPQEFVELMETFARYYSQVTRVGLYAHLLHDLNTADHAGARLLGRVREASAEQGAHLVFFDLEVADLTDEQVKVLYADERAARYRHAVEHERKNRPHQLSHVEERLLTDISPVGTGAWTRLFDELTSAIRVGWEGREVPLELALSNLYDGDREVRERATHATTEALRRDARTRTYVFNVVLQDKAIDDRLRKYPSWISSRNLANETSDASVEALVEAVTGRYDIVARYYRVKRGLLGLDGLHEWDRYAPIEETTRHVSWDEAKEIVRTSYHRFSPRAGAIIDDFFTKGWIDAPVVPDKSGGAYCSAGLPELHPFVLLNFTGRLRDATVVAHELGHGMHDVLSSGRNHIFDYHPPLTLAETASVFGEAMTFDAILSEEKDPKVRLSMLCAQVEDAFATIFRQVAMNRFEDGLHRARRESGELSQEQISEIWQEKIQAMFGDSLTLTEEHKVWWSYVHHFIRVPGYVYAYAFGNLLALSVYRRHLELQSPAFVEKYLEFLSLGGSRTPEEAVRTVDLDITDPGFWSSGLDIVSGMVDEVERLVGDTTG
jgi:oligoendopeptidase F